MPARDLSAGIVARLGDRIVYPAFLYEGTFYSAGAEVLVNAWTGYGTLSWDSKSWAGQGNLLGISAIEESTDIRAIGFEVTLTGVKSANISLALQSGRQGKPGKIWLALFTAAHSGALADTPYQLRRGKLNVMRIEDSGEEGRIRVLYEGALAGLSVARERRYTHEDQQISHPGDLGFEYVPRLQDVKIPWGRASG